MRVYPTVADWQSAPRSDDGAIIHIDALPGGQVEILERLLPKVLALVTQGADERHERRIERLVEAYLDVDPLESVERDIDEDNAEARRDFMATVPTLDSAEVHRRSGRRGAAVAQTAHEWKRAGRILGVPFDGRDAFPAFQFQEGRPRPIMRRVLAALPGDLTPWQRAFWLTSATDDLGGAAPSDLVKAGDERVVEAARQAYEIPYG